MLEIAYGVATDPGVQRAVNEDSVLAVARLAAVADGMGGHAAGDLASHLAIERLEELAVGTSPLGPDDVLAGIADANRRILDVASNDSSREGMGTTLTGVGVGSIGGSDHWIVFNVGDSRVYQWSYGALTQVTVDHSEVEELVAAGELSAEQARVDPRRNIVTRSLGTDPAPQADIWVFPPTPGERFVVCSDGLTLEMTDQQIGDVLRDQSDPQRAADMLVARAIEAGGRDNISVVVVDLAPAFERSDVSIDTDPRPDRSAQGSST